MKTKQILAVFLIWTILCSLFPLMIFAENEESFVVHSDGTEITQSKNVVLSANKDASWEIHTKDGTWVKIYGKQGKNLEVTHSMVISVVKDRSVEIRATDGSQISSPIRLSVGEDQKKEVPKKVSRPRKAPSGEKAETYNIVVNYLFADNSIAADPYVATVKAGDQYSAHVDFPSIVGYSPYVEDEETSRTSMDLEFTSVDSNQTINVVYRPGKVKYRVEYWLQNVENDDYTFDSSTELEGETQSVPNTENIVKKFSGFYALPADDVPLAADGSTVIRVYYDRVYYLVDLEASGAYGSDPVYAKYGTKIVVNNPTKPGYTFLGWKQTEPNGEDGGIPETMPSHNTKFQAQWNAQTVGYTVTYLYENADDDGYSPVGVVKKTAQAGSYVNPSDFRNVNAEDTDEKEYFTFNAEKTGNTQIEIKGDGTTNLNVYYSRNVYIIQFYAYLKSDNQREKVYQFSAKYNQNIKNLWPSSKVAEDSKNNLLKQAFEHEHNRGGDYRYGYGSISGWELNSGDTSTYSSKRLRMTQDLCNNNDKSHTYIATAHYSNNTNTNIYYYKESLDQTSPASGKDNIGENRVEHTYTYWNWPGFQNVTMYYNIDPDLSQEGIVNGDWGAKELTGFTNVDTKVYDDYRKSKTYYGFYYSRNKYSLKFISAGNEVANFNQVPYEKPLCDEKIDGVSITDYQPPYPSNFTPNTYTFAGWYDNNECSGDPVDFSEVKMPAADTVYFAKWVPITYDVKIYTTEADAADQKDCLSEQQVSFNEYAALVDTPTYGKYQFVGWFYRGSNQKEHSFNFSTKTVTSDLTIYGKWTSDVVVNYKVKYTTPDGVEVAPERTGRGLAGTAKTFEAEYEGLYESYKEGWFPTPTSHTMMLDIEGDNTYTFVYQNLGKLNYKVKYVSSTTGQELHPEKKAQTGKAAVTERFVPIEGMVPDHFYKTLILSIEELMKATYPDGDYEHADLEDLKKKNETDESSWPVITFTYSPDSTHAIYVLQKYIEDPNNERQWKLYNSLELLANIGDVVSTASAEQENIFGYDLNLNEPGTVRSGTVSKEGLILKLYYTAHEYPYKIKYVDRATGKEIKESKEGVAKYGQTLSETAPKIPKWDLYGNSEQTLKIRQEETDEPVNNVLTFRYVIPQAKFTYVSANPAMGDVSTHEETVSAFLGIPIGSSPVAYDGYRFEGWYSDKECTNKVEANEDNLLIPQKQLVGEDLRYVDSTFYAKFVEDVYTVHISESAEVSDAFEHKILLSGLQSGQKIKVNGKEQTALDDGTLSFVLSLKNGESADLVLPPETRVSLDAGSETYMTKINGTTQDTFEIEKLGKDENIEVVHSLRQVPTLPSTGTKEGALVTLLALGFYGVAIGWSKKEEK